MEMVESLSHSLWNASLLGFFGQLPFLQKYFVVVVLDFVFIFSHKISFVGFGTKKGAWESCPGMDNIFALLIVMFFLLQRLFSVMAPTQTCLVRCFSIRF